MSDKHPYTPATGHIVQVINHFRKSFPSIVTAETLKKLGFAPKNESYVINILRFLDIIDQDGNKTSNASKVFSLHDDSEFYRAFGELVRNAYKDLFDLYGDNSWEQSSDALITFFRSTDVTTAIVGKLQASTFQLLAAFSGYGEIPEPKASSLKKSTSIKEPATKLKKEETTSKKNNAKMDNNSPLIKEKTKDIGLTVRIEINLPSDGDQLTYDRIFKSIRENLIDG